MTGDNYTDGDFHQIECPHCGKFIRDLWDGGSDLTIGDDVECPHCEGTSVIEDYRVEITIRAVVATSENSGG